MNKLINYENILKVVSEPGFKHIKDALDVMINAIHLYEYLCFFLIILLKNI